MTEPALDRGRMTAATAAPESRAKSKTELPKTISKTNAAVEEELSRLGKLRGGCACYPFLSSGSINDPMVDEVFTDLRERYGRGGKRLMVVVDSGGGSIDAAYSLAELFRRYGTEELVFVVPRWAKSAATLLVCAGDRILMSPIAELGPLDPQITTFNPLENRLESLSPLHIDATLDLIRKEYKDGNQKLADGLMQRLQFPLTLGSYRKMLEIGEVYVERLLSGRMLKADQDVAKSIGRKLARDYSDHSFVINLQEAQQLGLVAEELSDDELDVVWRIHLLDKHRRELAQRQKEKENEERLKRLPPELLDQLRTSPHVHTNGAAS
jgi:ClpP class serine protease